MPDPVSPSLEGRLRASEERLSLALEVGTIGTWEWDVDRGEVVFAGVERLLGLPPGALAPTWAGYLTHVHDDDQAAVDAALSRAAEADVARERVEHRAETPGGVRWLELHARGEAQQGTSRRVAGVIVDVTDRHRLAEELRHAQKMDSVGRLAGGVAHDFNNLLTGILGSAEMLISGLAEDDPSYEDVAAIRDAGRRAAALTRHLLLFSRKQGVELFPLQLDELVRAFVPMLGRLIGEDVEVGLDIAVGLPAVLGDRSQIEQVLMNLAVNARDAMPRGGALTIELAPVHLPEGRAGELAPGSYVRLSVKDSGVGMSAELQARVFEPFFTTKPRGHGTGLGLATVQAIAQGHGGTAAVESAPGRGARFDVFLPAAAAGGERVPVPAPPSPAATGRGETVLVVDDEPLVRRALGRALASRGFVVLEASSGEEALAVVSARGGKVDLLLSDVVMSGMRGAELVKRFRAACPARPALLMSGYPEGRFAEALEADGYLQKPVATEALARAVRDALDRVGARAPGR